VIQFDRRNIVVTSEAQHQEITMVYLQWKFVFDINILWMSTELTDNTL
jgi:hypothetical protein